jgi:hypothetical protein
MKLTYIFHSCFALEADCCNVLFDFYKDTDETDGFVYGELLKSDKPLYVLSSHSHFDHFNPEILTWAENRNNIYFVLSKDIRGKKGIDFDDAFYIDKGEEYKDENLYIKAFGSTDVGVSFYIRIEGKKFFHAGDLNNWHWMDESTKEEVKKAEDFYHRELNDVAREVSSLDVVMFPVDPGLGTDFFRGAREFITKIPCDILIPMHFGNEFSKIKPFEDVAKLAGCRYIPLNEKGQTIILKK